MTKMMEINITCLISIALVTNMKDFMLSEKKHLQGRK